MKSSPLDGNISREMISDSCRLISTERVAYRLKPMRPLGRTATVDLSEAKTDIVYIYILTKYRDNITNYVQSRFIVNN